MSKFEDTYGKIVKSALWLVLPVKNIFIETSCEVHVFINNRAVQILRNDGYLEAFDFYSKNIECINKGAVWADQDFKSRDHFYNPYSKKGLYGCKTSKYWFENWYRYALIHWESGAIDTSMFYLGAALHLIQDSTIPQHGNINLMKNHRSYEQWIIKIHENISHYSVNDKGIYYDSPYNYINMNSKCAIEIYKRYSLIKNLKDKYYKITNVMLPLAQRTTAGCLLNFYNSVSDIN